MPPDRNLFSHVLTSRTAQVKPVVTAAKAGDNHMIGESEQPIVCRLAIEPAAPLLDTPRCNCKTICCVSCVPDGVLQYCLVLICSAARHCHGSYTSCSSVEWCYSWTVTLESMILSRIQLQQWPRRATCQVERRSLCFCHLEPRGPQAPHESGEKKTPARQRCCSVMHHIDLMDASSCSWGRNSVAKIRPGRHLIPIPARRQANVRDTIRRTEKGLLQRPRLFCGGGWNMWSGGCIKTGHGWMG